MKSKSWHSLIGYKATCARCGAISQYKILTNWYSTYVDKGFHLGIRTKDLSYWKWWAKFKQHHVDCPNKLGS